MSKVMALSSAVIVLCVALGVGTVVGQQPAAPAAPTAAAPAPGGPAGAPGIRVEGEFVIVEAARGEWTDREGALKQALRQALEMGGKVEIFSQSQVANYELIHDTILTRAEGIVTDYQVIKEERGVGGTWIVIIKAKVSKKSMHDSWGAIQNVLDQMGRPKIMIQIIERIDGKQEEQSILETEIEKRLLKSGFDLVDQKQIEEVMRREAADAAADKDGAKVAAIAKGFGAQILIWGTANANQAGMEEAYGVPLAMYNCDVQLKVFYTDTAKLLASEGIPQTRGGARGRKEFSPQAGKQALSFAGQKVVESIYQQVLSQWATAISAGGEIVLEVSGLKAAPGIRLRKAIEGMEGIRKVNYDMSKGVATYRINGTLSSDQLFEKLAEGEFEKVIELLDLKPGRIQAKAVGTETPASAPR